MTMTNLMGTPKFQRFVDVVIVIVTSHSPVSHGLASILRCKDKKKTYTMLSIIMKYNSIHLIFNILKQNKIKISKYT